MHRSLRPNQRFYLFNNRTQDFVEVRHGTILGRQAADIQFPEDSLVSRKQCQFEIRGNEVLIEDFSATNRTHVNTVPLESRRKRRLHLYDVIEFGTQRLILTDRLNRPPANTEDLIRAQKFHRGLLKDDGSLTLVTQTRVPTKTLIRLSPSAYRKLAVKKAVRRAAWHSRMAAPMIGLLALAIAGGVWFHSQNAERGLASAPAQPAEVYVAPVPAVLQAPYEDSVASADRAPSSVSGKRKPAKPPHAARTSPRSARSNGH